MVRAAAPSLKQFKGDVIALVLPNPNRPGGLQRLHVKLLNVEANGIWVEEQTLTERFLAKLDLPAFPKVITVFYPYAAIHAILGNLPGLSLSEKAFDV